MNKMTLMKMHRLRDFLKDDVRRRTDFTQTDQTLGVDMPPVQAAATEGHRVLPLPKWQGEVHPQGSFDQLVDGRKSVRKYLDEPLTASELSYLLYMTQGVRREAPGRVLRTVPSAGNRHSTETYLALTVDVPDRDGNTLFEHGLWHYLPLDHALEWVGHAEDLEGRIAAAALDQAFVGKAPAVFFWAVAPYRTEWRYAEASHKVIAIDLGHVCQNLYLAAQSIGCGTCAVAAYDQQKADALFSLDGADMFVAYLAPVGKIR